MTAADWDLTSYFPSLESGDYRTFRASLEGDADSLRRRADTLGALTDETRIEWLRLLADLEAAGARYGHLSSYLSCLGAADANDDQIARETAKKAELAAAFAKTFVAVRSALGEAEQGAFDGLVADEKVKAAGYYVARLRERAKRAMPAALEDLAADLAVNGLGAWGRLYDSITGKLTFELEKPGQARETLPVSMVLTNLSDADPEVRKRTMAGSARAWESASSSIAACLNAISGTRLSLYARRGIDDFLEPALFDAGIARTTLEALMETIRSRQELARRYLIAKARLIGAERLGFEDLLAPLPSAGGRISWSNGVERVLSAFASYPELASFAASAFKNKWIDFTPRQGKRPGGFCTSSHHIGESRIFMTYNGSFGDVQTLAHELGHAFHNHTMRDMRSWQRSYPMTLAETASTFAEQLVTDAALEAATGAQRLAILDQRLLEAAVFTLNIPMRFDFEVDLYERRKAGELSVTALKEMMIAAQRKNFADALDPARLDPWYWASKLHFYITDVSFYNFPYSFGYLFSLGLFARAKQEGPRFLPTYRDLLRRTGSASAEAVALDVLGIDLGKPGFWNESHDLIAADLAAFEDEAAGVSL